MKSVTRGLALFVAAASLLIATKPGRADLYVLRTFSGSATSYGLSANGLVTGGTGAGHAYTFDGTNITDYGLGPVGTYFVGKGVNASGHVVGYSDDGSGHVVAVYAASPSNQFYSFDPLGGHYSIFADVSDRINPSFNQGDICGYATDPTDTYYHAIGFDATTNIYTGFPEPPGTISSYGLKITAFGNIVGYYSGNDTPGGLNGFYWNQDAGLVLLSGTLPEGRYSFIEGMDVNNTIACGGADDASGKQHAVTWNGTSLTPLPLSYTGYPNYDVAIGIRTSGRAVGQGTDASGNNFVATLWDGNLVEDLNTVTVNPNGSTPTISLNVAENIDEAGQIVCVSEDSNSPRAVRLDPFGPTAITIKGAPTHGKPVKGTITLNMAAPKATTVTVLSSNHAVLADFTVKVPKGKKSVSFKSLTFR